MPKAMARHILVKTEAEAAQLKKRLANGEAFDVLARKYSTCPSGKKGGDLGEVRRPERRALDEHGRERKENDQPQPEEGDADG